MFGWSSGCYHIEKMPLLSRLEVGAVESGLAALSLASSCGISGLSGAQGSIIMHLGINEINSDRAVQRHHKKTNRSLVIEALLGFAACSQLLYVQHAGLYSASILPPHISPSASLFVWLTWEKLLSLPCVVPRVVCFIWLLCHK